MKRVADPRFSRGRNPREGHQFDKMFAENSLISKGIGCAIHGKYDRNIGNGLCQPIAVPIALQSVGNSMIQP